MRRAVCAIAARTWASSSPQAASPTCCGFSKVDVPLTRIAKLVGGGRAHDVFDVHKLKAGGTAPLPERPLEKDGGNAFAALLALKTAPGGQAGYDFILKSLRSAFPNVVDELGLRLTENNVEVSVTAPGGPPPLSIRQQANGLVQYLANLIALVSAKPGDVIALDQPEDGLHPWALKVLLSSLEDWAWDNRLTVILATHSLVLLDAMGGAPERVFVMKAHKVGEPSPAPLTALYDRDWHQGFTLGDLYAEARPAGTRPRTGWKSKSSAAFPWRLPSCKWNIAIVW